MIKKYNILALAVLASALPLSSSHADTVPPFKGLVRPELIEVSPSKAYIPLGFDDNDNVQVVVDGQFSNTCYKVAAPTGRIDFNEKKIYVRQSAFYYPGGVCAQMESHYSSPLDLGILPPGEYKVMTKSKDDSWHEQGILPVVPSTTSSPDDHLYAPVIDARVLRGKRVVSELSTSGKPASVVIGEEMISATAEAEAMLKIRIQLTSSCMKFDRLSMNVRANRVVEVLPITRFETGVDCESIDEEIELSETLPAMEHNRYLFHIRSLTGRAVNLITDL